MVDATLAVAVIGGTAVLGYLSNAIFERTRVPDVLWLILFGIIVAWAGALPSSGLLLFAPVLASIAIVVMSFEFGLRTDFWVFLHGLPRTTLLAILNLIFSTIGVGLVSYALFGLDLVRALLLGAIVSGISSATVGGIVRKMRMKDEFKDFLRFEAVLGDALAFIIAVSLINIYALAGTGNPAQTVASGFAVGIFCGLLIGVLRLAGSGMLKGKPYDYMLTLGLAFLAYSVAEWIGGIGVIAAIIYGLMLGNAKKLPKQFGSFKDYNASPFLKKFYSEISLFLRAFFFVLLGSLAMGAFNGSWWYGFVILAVLIVLRMPTVELALVKKAVTRQEFWLMKGMIPRDLSVIVLVLLAASKGVIGADAWLGVAFIVVLGSVLYTTLMTLALTRGQPVIVSKSREVSYEELPSKKPRMWKKFGEK